MYSPILTQPSPAQPVVLVTLPDEPSSPPLRALARSLLSLLLPSFLPSSPQAAGRRRRQPPRSPRTFSTRAPATLPLPPPRRRHRRNRLLILRPGGQLPNPIPRNPRFFVIIICSSGRLILLRKNCVMRGRRFLCRVVFLCPLLTDCSGRQRFHFPHFCVLF